MSIEFTNRQEKGSPLTMLEMDAILDLIKDAVNALESLMLISLNADGTLKNPGFFSGASTNGTDSYTATVVGIAAQADLLGKLLILKCDVANTGPSSLDVNSYGAHPIMRFQDQAIESDYIKAGRYIFLTWDGSNYIMQSTAGVVPPINFGIDTGAVNAYVVAKTGFIAIPATLYPGYSIHVKTANANTGASTLALGALAPVSILRKNGASLIAGDISAGIFEVIYDSANFVIPTASSAKVMTPWVDTNTLSTYGTNGVASTPHGLGSRPDTLRVVFLSDSADATAGYAAGVELNAETAQQSDGDSAVAVSSDATTVYVVLRPEGAYKVPKGDSTGTPNLDPTLWRLKIYAAKL